MWWKWRKKINSPVAKRGLRQTARLQLEPLEDRLAPATLTTLGTFIGAPGYGSNVVMDSHGNLFGTYGGDSDDTALAGGAPGNWSCIFFGAPT